MKYTLILFVVDGITRNGAGNDMDDMTAPDQLRALHERLSLRAAGERVEKAHYVADLHLKNSG